jgi:hypothetical protein
LVGTTGFYYFKSSTPGFGQYVIYAEDAKALPSISGASSADLEETEIDGDRRIFSRELFNQLVMVVVALIGVVLGTLLLLLFLKKPKDKFSGKYVKIKVNK